MMSRPTLLTAVTPDSPLPANGSAATPDAMPGAPFFHFATRRLARALPPAARALVEPNGLLAAGGDLAVATLLAAYRDGVFPWYGAGQPRLWWSPDPRAVLPLDSVHVSRRLRRTLRRGAFTVTVDRAFEAVVAACAAPRQTGADTWITPEMAAAYSALHRAGHAHSLECWRDGELAGGIYGVAVGRAFCGESMFSRRTDGSKIALVALARRLLGWGYALFDCQMQTEHLASMGAVSMPRTAFIALLRQLRDESVDPAAWQDRAEQTP